MSRSSSSSHIQNDFYSHFQLLLYFLICLHCRPLDDAVSKWQYRLTATDSGNESVTETVEISVQQHRGVRTVNHEINIAVKINEKNIHYIDWQLKLIEGKL